MPKILNRSGLSHEMRVATGWYADTDYIDKYGLNPDITTGTDPEDIWEGGGTYSFSDTDDIVSISSSNDTDTQTINIQGLDIDGNLVIQQATLQGQTVVTLNIPLWRVFRAGNQSDTTLQGNIYIYSGTENTGGIPSGASVEKARITSGNNQTLMAIYTIPKGKVGFLKRGEIGLEYEGSVGSGVNFARCSYRSKRQNQTFKVKKVITVSNNANSVYADNRSFPDVLPALTDIKITCEEVTEDCGIWATLDIELIDETSFSTEFLNSIGQQ